MSKRRVGTVLGLNTYAELADLITVSAWNLMQLDSVKACPPWAAKDPQGYGAWAGKVYDAEAALNAAINDAEAAIDLVPEGLRSVTPVTSPLFTKNAWDKLLDAAQPFHALTAEFVAKSGCPWPQGSPPQPTAPDFDLKVYQWTGKALAAVQFGGSLGLIVIAALVLMSFNKGSSR